MTCWTCNPNPFICLSSPIKGICVCICARKKTYPALIYQYQLYTTQCRVGFLSYFLHEDNQTVNTDPYNNHLYLSSIWSLPYEKWNFFFSPIAAQHWDKYDFYLVCLSFFILLSLYCEHLLNQSLASSTWNCTLLLSKLLKVCIWGNSRTLIHVDIINIIIQNKEGLCVQRANSGVLIRSAARFLKLMHLILLASTCVFFFKYIERWQCTCDVILKCFVISFSTVYL